MTIDRLRRTLRDFFTGRIFLSLLSFALAAVAAFVLLPGIYRDREATVQITRVKERLDKGQRITPAHLETIEVGAYNLPPGVLPDAETVIGMYAASLLLPGDFLFEAKLTAYRLDPLLDTVIAGGWQLLTVTPKNSAQVLAAHLQSGDIVAVATITESRQSMEMQRQLDFPEELSQLVVFAVESARGSALGNSGEKGEELLLSSVAAVSEDLVPRTITFMVDEVQARLLLEAEYGGGFHIILKERRP